MNHGEKRLKKTNPYEYSDIVELQQFASYCIQKNEYLRLENKALKALMSNSDSISLADLQRKINEIVNGENKIDGIHQNQ